MATLRDDHPRIRAFLRAKRNVDFAEWRLNISMLASDAFFQAVEVDKAWELRDCSGNVVEILSARDLLREIAVSAHYCGDPGVLFRDRLERDNPTPQWPYVSTAPCAELAMAQGDACHFSYINVSNLVRGDALDMALLGEVAALLVRMLDAVTEVTVRGRSDALPLVAQKRRIGIGITGFADLLLHLHLPYDSHATAILAAEIAEVLDFHTKRASVALAAERGAFPAIAESRFRDRSWVARKLEGKLLRIDRDQWNALIDDIMRYGVRNASTTSMPPSGTSSEIAGISKSLEPYISLRDRDGMLFKVFRDLKLVQDKDDDENRYDDRLRKLPFVSLAQDIKPLFHLMVQARFQSFLDDGISKTINLDQNCTVDAVFELFRDAYRCGVKGLTVFRDNCLVDRDDARL
ncbi:putative B12-dependent ribonucleoside-diphosphate/-triphosphate reductase (nrdJ-like) (plasmid) [Tistrella mobilis KA081020-065]|uniref:B12-dependent ribonucleoside-diphosphate/-triphosphate reductase (NrdJ-like) n=2 Tax=Tistrella mobilis TaxID=171437 RepID=I3TWE3_TISMK|nr:putative B12-dependent ribonucleoside-diphosphate/-triphosphate reductase (nrdJ-like) [Tistrella mobilis KA081020-065]